MRTWTTTAWTSRERARHCAPSTSSKVKGQRLATIAICCLQLGHLTSLLLLNRWWWGGRWGWGGRGRGRGRRRGPDCFWRQCCYSRPRPASSPPTADNALPQRGLHLAVSRWHRQQVLLLDVDFRSVVTLFPPRLGDDEMHLNPYQRESLSCWGRFKQRDRSVCSLLCLLLWLC